MFNSLKYAKILEESGLSRKQAETHIQIISEIIGGGLVTKEELKKELKHLEDRMTIKMGIMMASFLTFAVTLNQLLN